ncbi:MAG: beta-ketoacyl-ACP synthase II [Bacillota bacterium]|jgi:3-oxoacyl-[acyl-carrier-protein] synthase II
MKRRVVITGLGAITPLGTGADKFWNGLCKGENGIALITRFDISNSKAKLAAEVKDFEAENFIDRKERRRMDRFTQFAVAATAMAIEDAGFSKGFPCPERTGTAISSGIGGMETFEEQHVRFLEMGPDRVSPFFIPMMIGNMAAGNVSIMFNAKGPSTAVVTACASGGHSIADAARLIQDGHADVMIAGGSEAAITPLSVAGFAAMQALSTANNPEEAPRPFDLRRSGFVMGEGAGILILEEHEQALKRGARIYAEVAGYGTSTDAYHITSPSPDGEGAARAITEALANAGIDGSKVGYVNAHGTGTELNDKYETMALKRAFGEHAYKLAISSTKSMHGHLLGAAGAVEAIVLAKALQEGFVPPTTKYGVSDPECDLDYVPNVGRKMALSYGISNSLGFGGHNVTLVFKHYEGR